MTSTSRLVLAAAWLLSISTAALANDAEKRCVYSAPNILTFFTAEMKAELKITPDQERSLKGSEERRTQIWQRYSKACGEVANSKLSEREKNAKLRGLEIQVVDDLCKVYSETLWPAQLKRMKQIVLQVRGMEIFDYPEIRSALKMGDPEVRELQSAYGKLATEYTAQLRADVEAKKITNQEAARKLIRLTFSVPKKVRETLSKEQQRILDDLLGEKYVDKK
ncbi:MAG TPA: hypothetical protein VKS79_04610 [Gemmataceae bacterium]|nr:hypothetical protein [Gemmataceae bacterium]